MKNIRREKARQKKKKSREPFVLRLSGSGEATFDRFEGDATDFFLRDDLRNCGGGGSFGGDELTSNGRIRRRSVATRRCRRAVRGSRGQRSRREQRIEFFLRPWDFEQIPRDVREKGPEGANLQSETSGKENLMTS